MRRDLWRCLFLYIGKVLFSIYKNAPLRSLLNECHWRSVTLRMPECALAHSFYARENSILYTLCIFGQTMHGNIEKWRK